MYSQMHKVAFVQLEFTSALKACMAMQKAERLVKLWWRRDGWGSRDGDGGYANWGFGYVTKI